MPLFGSLLFVFLQRLLYELFNLNKKFINFYPIAGIILFVSSFIFIHSILLSIVFFVIISVDIFRAIIVGVVKKSAGYKYVVIGSLIFILGIIYQLGISFVQSLNYNPSSFVQYSIITIYFLALPISMSILLARKSAVTNKNLSKQLLTVKILSAKTLEQEQEKKHILENQKEKLEYQVKERTAEVVLQKEKIEEINKHTIASITYASRIQKAILGNINEITPKFKDAFIFLKPHSIVSGDFYWFSELKNIEKGDLQIIIAADCTGHGVPGAFMTVMGHDFLEEIVNKQNILLPNKILHELDKRVISNLKKETSAEQVDDGMDITILVYEKDNKKLHFSGANNPMFYVRNNELTQIKGSKFPIGGDEIGERKKEYVLNTIEVEENDKFYIFSDGFQDQFGGEKNRKYLTKFFKELILKNSHYAMSKQKQLLETELLEWKSNRNQTDDILIIGLEF